MMKIKRVFSLITAIIIVLTILPCSVNAEWHKTDEGNYYYIKSNGEKATGFVKINGNSYYFSKNGMMYKGWLKYKSSYYYYGSNGKKVTGWKTISQKKYYFNSNGKMQTGNVVINGLKYTFSSNGVWNGQNGITLSGTEALLDSVELNPDYFLSDGTDEYGSNSELFAKYFGKGFSVNDADKLIKNTLEDITEDKISNSEKVKAVYDWIIKNTSYEFGGYGNYLSVDCLINDKIETCADYSYVFMTMMRYMGYDATVVNGQTHKCSGGYTGHQWVEVNIGGTVYVFDPQIEDNIAGTGTIQYLRYCKTYNEVSGKYKK